MAQERQGPSQSYQEFLGYVDGNTEDTLPRDQEFPATEDEVRWWKGHQVKRAIGKMRIGEATPVDMSLIREKTNIIPSTATKARIRRKEQ